MEPSNLQDLQDLIISTEYPVPEDKAWSIPVQILIDQYETTQYNDALSSGNFSLVLEPDPSLYTGDLVSKVPKKRPTKKRTQKTKGTSTRHICDTCEKEFDTKTLFIRHLVSHTDECHYSCDECDKKFKYPWLRDKHMKLKHHADSSSVHQPSLSSCGQLQGTQGGTIHTCKVCNLRLPYWSAYVTHLKTHTDVKELKCPRDLCNKSFKTVSQLNDHLKSHDKAFTCKVCSRSFKSRSGLKSHEIKHTAPPRKKETCSICSLQFDSHKALKMHQRAHNKEPLLPARKASDTGTIELSLENNAGQTEKFGSISYEKVEGRTSYKCQLCRQIKFKDLTSVISHVCVTHSLCKVTDRVIAKKFHKIVDSSG